jgi:heme/copper-type cytochrome/quinol oxidase subunit 2
VEVGIVAIVAVGVIVVVAALLPLAIFLRCRRIDALRNEKLRDSYAAAAADMKAGEQTWEWRFDANQNAPAFNEMVWKVWRPVSSFYKDPPVAKR